VVTHKIENNLPFYGYYDPEMLLSPIFSEYTSLADAALGKPSRVSAGEI